MALGDGKGGQFRYNPLCQPQPGEERHPLQLGSFSASLDMPSSSLACTDPDNTGRALSQLSGGHLLHKTNSQFPESFYNQQLSFSSCRNRCTISRDFGFLAQAAASSKRKGGGPKALCETVQQHLDLCSSPFPPSQKGAKDKDKIQELCSSPFRLVQLWGGMSTLCKSAASGGAVLPPGSHMEAHVNQSCGRASCGVHHGWTVQLRAWAAFAAGSTVPEQSISS